MEEHATGLELATRGYRLFIFTVQQEKAGSEPRNLYVLSKIECEATVSQGIYSRDGAV